MLRHSCLALTVVVLGSLPAVGKADRPLGQPIYVQNDTNQTIWVAARYIPPGSSNYANDGYWKIEPGQRVLILYNNGVWIYLHYHCADGTVLREDSKPVRETIRGKTVDLYPYKLRGFEPRTIRFFTQR